jgi:Skp family chaperone for outer membrane proteins
MSDPEITYLKDQINQIQNSINKMNDKLDAFSQNISDYKTKNLECKDAFDNRYILTEDFENAWNTQMKKYQKDSIDSMNNKTNLIKNIFNIIQILSPYLIILLTFKM